MARIWRYKLWWRITLGIFLVLVIWAAGEQLLLASQGNFVWFRLACVTTIHGLVIFVLLSLMTLRYETSPAGLASSTCFRRGFVAWEDIARIHEVKGGSESNAMLHVWRDRRWLAQFTIIDWVAGYLELRTIVLAKAFNAQRGTNTFLNRLLGRLETWLSAPRNVKVKTPKHPEPRLSHPREHPDRQYRFWDYRIMGPHSPS